MKVTALSFLMSRYVFSGILILTSASQAAIATKTPQLVAKKVTGSVEVRTFGAVWRPLTQQNRIQQGIRTGSGRVILSYQQAKQTPGQIIIGSHSLLRLNNQKPDFQKGQFWLQGPISAYVSGNHIALDKQSQARIDLSSNGKQQRIAILKGQLRIARSSKITTLKTNEQLHLNNGQIQAFSEKDPWYKARFIGTGTAKIEALKGHVKLARAQQMAKVNVGETLNTKDLLMTSTQAWAEIGFEGGGYLRLGANSNLRVVGIEKTSQGREITLHLLKGTAWNVVTKDKGGYRLTTPVVSTAVRGTKFRVDANGLVKVLEGNIYFPSNNDKTLAAGQQRNTSGQIGKLKLDAYDKANLALDAERSKPLSLRIKRFPRYISKATALTGNTLPDTKLRATFHFDKRKTSMPIKVDKDGQFTIPIDHLSENNYQMRLKAQRFGKVRLYSTYVSIDRTAPTVQQLQQFTQGRITLLTGQISDNSKRAVLLEAKIGDQVIAKRKVIGKFRMLLNSSLVKKNKVTLRAVDTAGNEVNATSP